MPVAFWLTKQASFAENNPLAREMVLKDSLEARYPSPQLVIEVAAALLGNTENGSLLESLKNHLTSKLTAFRNTFLGQANRLIQKEYEVQQNQKLDFEKKEIELKNKIDELQNYLTRVSGTADPSVEQLKIQLDQKTQALQELREQKSALPQFLPEISKSHPAPHPLKDLEGLHKNVLKLLSRHSREISDSLYCLTANDLLQVYYSRATGDSARLTQIARKHASNFEALGKALLPFFKEYLEKAIEVSWMSVSSTRLRAKNQLRLSSLEPYIRVDIIFDQARGMEFCKVEFDAARFFKDHLFEIKALCARSTPHPQFHEAVMKMIEDLAPAAYQHWTAKTLLAQYYTDIFCNSMAVFDHLLPFNFLKIFYRRLRGFNLDQSILNTVWRFFWYLNKWARNIRMLFNIRNVLGVLYPHSYQSPQNRVRNLNSKALDTFKDLEKRLQQNWEKQLEQLLQEKTRELEQKIKQAEQELGVAQRALAAKQDLPQKTEQLRSLQEAFRANAALDEQTGRSEEDSEWIHEDYISLVYPLLYLKGESFLRHHSNGNGSHKPASHQPETLGSSRDIQAVQDFWDLHPNLIYHVTGMRGVWPFPVYFQMDEDLLNLIRKKYSNTLLPDHILSALKLGLARWEGEEGIKVLGKQNTSNGRKYYEVKMLKTGARDKRVVGYRHENGVIVFDKLVDKKRIGQ